MKNVINYYYGIIVNEFKKRESNFIFNINNSEYEFVEYYRDINELINIYSTLKFYRKEVSEIILNKQNNIITYYENKPYILLKKSNYRNKEIELSDIISYDSSVYTKEELNWKRLWTGKLDYYEMQLDEVGIKYPILKQSFNYYLGLSEIAINLLNYVNAKNISYHISHKRLETKEDMVNPLNIIIDSRTRDVGEYIKVKYFYAKTEIRKLLDFIASSNFSKDEILLLLARLIYPSYYFDIYEKVFINGDAEKELSKIIKKNAEYEAFLKDIYNSIKQFYAIPQIEFLEY